MAVKKTSKTETTSGSAAKKSGAKAAAPKKSAVAAETASKSATPKASKSAAPKGAAPAGAPTVKKSAPKKPTELQTAFLTRVRGAGEEGYEVGQKSELKTLEALETRGLVKKKGPKNKATGNYRYIVSKNGHKHLSSSPSTSGG